MLDLPPAVLHNEISPQCVQMVASAYSHPPLVLMGILYAEGGRNGMKNQNKNKSYDLGVAQINTIWLPEIIKAGITEQDLRTNACKNLWTAGWILQRCSKRHKGNLWQAVGCYHAGENAKTPEQLKRLQAYSHRVYRFTQRSGKVAEQWLDGYVKPRLIAQHQPAQRHPPAKGVTMTIEHN